MNTVTLSQKERTLLEDAKSHEQMCIEKYTSYANQAKDTQLKQIFTVNGQAEQTHLDSLNQLLSGTIPQMNQQQNQAAPAPAAPAANWNTAQNCAINFCDASLCKDLLMTEKYVSGTYDTAIFECKNTQVRDLLNHIQKEEQKHGESIYKYMESKGLYNVQ